MFLLALCLVGTTMAMPAIPDAPVLLDKLPGPVFVSHPQLIMPYAAPPRLIPLRSLDIKIEPEPKEDLPENNELKEDLPENDMLKTESPEEPKETLLEPIAPALELPKPLDPESVIVKIDFNPATFITDWIHKVHEFFHLKNPPMHMYPGYAVVVDTKP